MTSLTICIPLLSGLRVFLRLKLSLVRSSSGQGNRQGCMIGFATSVSKDPTTTILSGRSKGWHLDQSRVETSVRRYDPPWSQVYLHAYTSPSESCFRNTARTQNDISLVTPRRHVAPIRRPNMQLQSCNKIDKCTIISNRFKTTCISVNQKADSERGYEVTSLQSTVEYEQKTKEVSCASETPECKIE